MAKSSTIRNSSGKKVNSDDSQKLSLKSKKNEHYLFSMSSSPDIDESTHWFQMLPAIIFTAVVIMITKMVSYQRPMEQFYWSTETNDLVDFFSYNKMVAILICAGFVLTIFAYRIFIQSLYVKRGFANVFILIYSALVILSYMFSDYELFALWGWNDRFEGTLSLLGYMILLFYIINSVNSEKNVKWMIYPIAGTSALLGLLGVTQALDHDFFRTTIGKKLITPSWFWNQLDSLNFTFQNKQIYQTVYNINYVSFYLTLLIPLFGMLLIRSIMRGKDEPIWRKIIWASLFALLIFNLIGSASSGGLLGLAVVVLIGVIILNKRILSWWKPLIVLIVLTLIVAGTTYQRWLPELSTAINLATGSTLKQEIAELSTSSALDLDKTEAADDAPHIDYIDTEGHDIIVSVDGESFKLTTYPNDFASVKLLDSDGKKIALLPTNEQNTFRFDDERFNRCAITPMIDDEGNKYINLTIANSNWPFRITEENTLYWNQLRNVVDLNKIPAFGFENNLDFGSGRGFIWSRSLPMITDTLLIGHGADTFCIYFPHNDYAGKYNWGGNNVLNLIIDKPHNMYIGMAVGTGLASVFALFALWIIYIIQSIQLYRSTKYDGFLEFAGAGIFFGICGFLVSGIVNDSSVSVMPLFYGLLGTGIAINQILKRDNKSV